MNTPDTRPREYIVPIEWQTAGEKTNAFNSVVCVEKQVYTETLARAERAEAEVARMKARIQNYKNHPETVILRCDQTIEEMADDFEELTKQAEICRAIILEFLDHSRECADDYEYVYGDIVQEARKALSELRAVLEGKK